MKILLNLFLLILISCASTESTQTENSPLTKVEGIEVLSQRNETVFIGKGKPTLVFFFNSYCPCSDSHMAMIKDLYKKYHLGVQFVGIHPHNASSLEERTEYFKALNLPFSVVEDPEYKLADKFGALKTPHVFFYDKNGKRLYHGGVTDVSHAPLAKEFYLENVLSAFKAGKKIPREYARALGCYIVRLEKE